jgi:dipeptide/tripeptide permease
MISQPTKDAVGWGLIAGIFSMLLVGLPLIAASWKAAFIIGPVIGVIFALLFYSFAKQFPGQEPPMKSNPPDEEKKEKRATIIGILVAIVAGIIIFAAIIFFYNYYAVPRESAISSKMAGE